MASLYVVNQVKDTEYRWRWRMDFGSVVRGRLAELGLEQKDLAAAAEVTESYISQLLSRKKPPPAPDRTDIYDKMEEFLKLPGDKLSKLVNHERRDELKKTLGELPTPLHQEVRELILRKCAPAKEKQTRAIFEKEPFGALEHLVTQKLLGSVKNAAKRELENESWLHEVAQSSGLSYEQVRVRVLEFLDVDVLTVSVENCVSFLDPLIESWDIDLTSFAMEIVLNQRLAPGHSRRLEFVEMSVDEPVNEEPGFTDFLRDRSLSGDVTEEETVFLKSLRFKGKRPTSLYYYRALQNLRDPLHFREE
jgi:transcriptional regulator with XRE-family HTH domain